MSNNDESKIDIVVIGSVNADIYIKIKELPKPGETILGHDDTGKMLPGGKGANQAYAASCLKSNVNFICKFGNDSHAITLKKILNDGNVNLNSCKDVDVPSGHAFILLQNSGENSIILSEGSNGKWDKNINNDIKNDIKDCKVVLLQREIPEYVNLEVCKYSQKLKKKVIMDVGGQDTKLNNDILPCLYVISPNESELHRLTNMKTDTIQQVVEASRYLQKQGATNILVKLGSRGSMLLDKDNNIITHPAYKIKKDLIKDTTGAGDCFTAAFAVGISRGLNYKDSLSMATAAAALCIQKMGAMPSMPSKEDTEKFIKENKLNGKIEETTYDEFLKKHKKD